MKQYNLATNLIFPFMFLTTSDILGSGQAINECNTNSRKIMFGISFIHIGLSLFSVFLSSLVHIPPIKKTIKKVLYFYYTLCLIILCAVLVFLLIMTNPEQYPVNFTCAQLWIVLKSYTLINPLSFLGMMFLFFFIAKRLKRDDMDNS